MTSLDTPITTLPKTSSITFKKLKSVSIDTFHDLLSYVPTRYKDYRTISSIRQAQLSTEAVTIKGEIIKTTFRPLKAHLSMQIVTIKDPTGQIDCIWFRQPYILTTLKKGMNILASGMVRRYGSSLQLYVDEYDIYRNEGIMLHSGRLVPIYSEKRGLSSKTLREKIAIVLEIVGDTIPDPLPKELVSKYHLIDEYTAFATIHFPVTTADAQKARNRLAFDELFAIQLSSRLVKKDWETQKVGHPFKTQKNIKKIDDFISSLPFTLTKAQKRVIREVCQDLSKSTPMNRLVQGDVGSGKTVIAAVAGYISYLSGYKTLVMAPTEILANQHYQTLTTVFQNTKLTISLRTSSNKDTTGDIVVGTHALISKKTNFSNVGLVVIDEQHKFGVSQRAALKESGVNPHLLTMTATPIPRSVCLTLYGELDLSLVDEMPVGRIMIKTYLVPPQKRNASYTWMKKQIHEEDAQIFIVCPLIEESQHETMQTVKAVTQEYEKLQDIFGEDRVGLLHGRMNSVEKEKAMANFKSREIDVLLATPVVEVGVDVPSATIMVIEGAERYGLAQLHQLRGRVGRGVKQSYCLLFTSGTEAKATERLNYFASNSSGFRLAEYDLMHRGTGELYGTKQHGASDLVMASLSNRELVETTRKCSDDFMNTFQLSEFASLETRIKKLQLTQIAKD